MAGKGDGGSHGGTSGGGLETGGSTPSTGAETGSSKGAESGSGKGASSFEIGEAASGSKAEGTSPGGYEITEAGHAASAESNPFVETLKSSPEALASTVKPAETTGAKPGVESPKPKNTDAADTVTEEASTAPAPEMKAETASAPASVEGTGFFSSYKDRLDQTPSVESGRWAGQRGESLCKAKSAEAQRILAEKGLEGIEYRSASPDMRPVSEETVQLGHMTDARHSRDVRYGRDGKDTAYVSFDEKGNVKSVSHKADKSSLADINAKYETPGNFDQADAIVAQRWSERDGREWTAEQVAQYRAENGLTWHEDNDGVTMMMIPAAINADFGHLGGVAEMQARNELIADALRSTEFEGETAVGDPTAGMTDAQVTAFFQAQEAKQDAYGAVETRGSQTMRELSFREASAAELHAVEVSCAAETFTDGQGMEITKSAAVDRMTGELSAALEQMQAEGRGVTDAQKQAILTEMRTALYAQEAESRQRAIGNHGVPHLYSVYERMGASASDEVLAQAAANIREANPGSKATAADVRAGMILAAAYHDEGYLSAAARQGAGHDLLHGVDSAIAFDASHRKNLDGVVDEAVLAQVRQAIAEHNGLPQSADAALKKAGVTGDSPARQSALDGMDLETPASMDPNGNFIRSSLLLSDRLGLDSAEKTPDLLRDEERARVMIAYYRKQAEAAGETDGADMRQALTDLIHADSSLSAEQKASFLTAIEKDVTPIAGKFDLPMAGVSIPADALQYRVTERDGRPVIEAEVTLSHRVDDAEYLEAFGAQKEGVEPPQGRQLRKALEDLGIPVEEGRIIPNGDGAYRVDTTGVPGLEHVTVRITEALPDEGKQPEAFMTAALHEEAALIEGQAEALVAGHAELAQAENQRRAMAEYQSLLDSGEVTRTDMLTLLGQLYTKENSAQIDRISAELAADPEMPEDQLRRLAEECAALHVPEAKTDTEGEA